MSLSRVQIDTPLAARIWRVVDDVKTAREQEIDEERYVARAAGLCTEFESDLFNARAREEIALFEAERLEYALSVLRETDRSQVAA
jgi:hypothetical protein